MIQTPSSPVVLISGANGGIGTAIARELLVDHRLSLGARSSYADDLIRSAIGDGRVHTAPFDAQNERHADEWVHSVLERYESIDAVVNCVGALSGYTFLDEDFAKLDRVIDVNVKAPIRLIRAAYPHLLAAANPKIVNLVSLSGLRVAGKDAGYAMSKFALRALGHSIRQAGWDQNVRVTSLCPGWVNTKMADGRVSIAPEQMTQPEDIAKIVRLLLSLPPTCSIAELAINCRLEP